MTFFIAKTVTFSVTVSSYFISVHQGTTLAEGPALRGPGTFPMNLLLAKSHLTKCPLAKCPLAKCPGTVRRY